MDANDTRFKLLLGRADWTTKIAPDPEHPETEGPSWDERLQELTLHLKLFQFPAPAGDTPVTPDDRRGADQDRFGTTYWIDEQRTAILAASAGATVAGRFWPGTGERQAAPAGAAFDTCAPATPAPPPQLAALAVTNRHYLVAGTTAPAGMLAFDLQSGGPPRRALWPAEVPFAPFDAAALPDGGALVLDREHQRLWTLDEQLQVRSLRPPATGPDPAAGDFAPLSGEQPLPSVPDRMQRRIDLDDALVLTGDPVAVVALPDGSALVLDRGDGVAPSQLRRYRDGAPAGAPVALTDADLGIALLGHDIAVVPGAALGTLFVAEASGNQAYAFMLDEEDGQLVAQLVRSYFPMREFGGAGIVSGPRGVCYDFGERWLALVAQCRPRFATEVWLMTPAPFDSGQPGCVWHRLMLDANIPPGSKVEVWSRAVDDPKLLPATDWVREPDPLARPDGPDRPYLRQPDPYATFELLFQRAQGRYLSLRLHLVGDGRGTPHLHALRALYPRFSYPEHYLPRAYREDEVSASFLERFLANVEGTQTALEDRILAARALLDPRAAPTEALDWLAGFFDVALDPAWSESRRRAFIAHAMDFFRWRGTPRGLRMALRIALDAGPEADADVFAEPEGRCSLAYRIIERFRLRTTPAIVAGDPTQALGPRPLDLGARWVPADGGDALATRFGLFLGRPGPVEWPMRPPDGTEAAAAWQAFTDATLGFVPSARPSDPDAQARWRAFLVRRYRTPAALSAAYGELLTSFGDVGLPDGELPPDGPPLRDWYEFETVVQAMRAAAHRFTVLLPTELGEEAASAPAELARRNLAQRIVELQKPAHTVFDVRLYWSAFRVGEARLGEGTLLGLGSRSPQLLRPVVLGANALGESRLGGEPAPQLTRPPSIGRRPRPEAPDPEAT
jgi:phage tail-like protein